MTTRDEGLTICMLACGTMGVAISSGVLDALNSSSTSSQTNGSNPFALPNRFLLCCKRKTTKEKLEKQYQNDERVSVLMAENVSAVRASTIILLTCKPQMVDTILGETGMKEALKDKTIISILAGVGTSQIAQHCDESTLVVRVMCNVACQIRQGMSVLCVPSEASASSRKIIEWMFAQIGRTMFLDEKHIDAVTALCGSGPAFACVILEALAEGGVQCGISFQDSLILAAQTMRGAADMVLQGQHPAVIKNSVSTPGGCTIEGLLCLEDGRIRSTLSRTIQQTRDTAKGLGAKQN